VKEKKSMLLLNSFTNFIF